MTSLRFLLSLAMVQLGVLATGCAPDRQQPAQQEDAAGQAEQSKQGKDVISDQDFETSDTGQWQATAADSEAASQDREEEKPPTP